MNRTFPLGPVSGGNSADNDDENDDDNAHLLRCWRIQDCKGCLEQPDCSWCPFSWTCVPNSHRVPLLAPAWDENICPHWAERWEVRTRPLGCQVSTITTLTSLVTIACTLIFVLLVSLVVLIVGKARAYGRKYPGVWKIWKHDWRARVSVSHERIKRIFGYSRVADTRNHGEQESLLPSSRDVRSAA